MAQLKRSNWLTACLALFLSLTLMGAATGSNEDQSGKRPLKISTIEQVPFLMYRNESRRKGNDQFYGFIPDLLGALCERKAVSCDYQLSLVKDGKYGWRYGGKWNGIIGEVFTHEADIGAAPLMISSLRQEAVDFTVPISNNTLALLVQEQWPIYTRENLLRLSTGWMRFGTLQSGWTKNAFATARDVVGASLWSMMADFPESIEEGVQRTRAGNYTFISSRDELEYYSSYYCGLDVRDEFYQNDPNGFAVRRRSGLLGPLNAGLKSLMEDGTYSQLRAKWWSPECTYSSAANMVAQWEIHLLGLAALCALLKAVFIG